MVSGLDFGSLRSAYLAETTTPRGVAREVVERIAARGDDGVWTARVAPDALMAEAARLEQRAAREGIAALPLYGLPFAVKDNIDAAGLPTTAACPDFGHMPACSAPVVERLLAAGALLVGKTNLDQFATGLVGTRSPYGVARNPFDAAYIPGGSSSGSAVAVAAGLVSFALGTDTAGSGRVPASFNNIVGLKPSRGLISTRGVTPACASLDCVSVFALTVDDTSAVLDLAACYDPEQPYSRPAPAGFAASGALPCRYTVGVPRAAQRAFFGNPDTAGLFDEAIARVERLGGIPVEIDFAPFEAAAAFLYRGPWLAERLAAIAAATGNRREPLHPVLRLIVEGDPGYAAADVYRAQEQLSVLRRRTAAIWREIDVLLVPTAGTIYRIEEIAADPLLLNENLGRYTNFTNLLDLSGLAVPSGFQHNGLPFGVTFLAPAFHDPLLAAIGAAFQRCADLPLGATGARLPARAARPSQSAYPYIGVAVVGAHLSGEPLNPELLALGSRFRRALRTSADYRLYALPDGKRPGLVRFPGTGAPIEIEIWDVPSEMVGAFLAGIAPPLGLGSIALEDRSQVTGFVCEAWATETALDITEYGGWRAYRAALRERG
ncbi:MAG: allophanate hydrolase [Alphaproteobacteria bacterium]|nr:allophanate hydrolase [Alphaproteobacteria bacterium]